MKDRFDLEQDIMNCWNVVEDLNLLYETLGNSPKYKDMPADLENEILNILLGMKSLYQMRFEHTWDTFEDLIKEKKLT